MDRAPFAGDDPLTWRCLGIVGLVFFCLGLANLGTVWLPLHLGEPEWELGTTSQFFDTFPLLGLGMAFLLTQGVALGRRWQVRGVATFCIVVAVLMWLALTVYATVLPMALKAVSDPVALTPIKKAAAKTGVQALLYPFALLWLAAAGWRASLRRRAGA